uniref:Uncharacterized protein n=1 Tax=Salix viminalis TaxID=40686 RepID=A0A6N2MGT0_SALVM
MGAGLRSPQEGDPTSKFVVEGAARAAAPAKFSLTLSPDVMHHRGSSCSPAPLISERQSLGPDSMKEFHPWLQSEFTP